jgi:hypothetical protein
MTISKYAVYRNDRDQVLQDIASNIDVLQDFIAHQKAKLLASSVTWQFVQDGAEADLIDMVLAENAAKSIHTLVIAEINGGYEYEPEDDDEEVAEGGPRDLEEVKAKLQKAQRKLAKLKAKTVRARRGEPEDDEVSA